MTREEYLGWYWRQKCRRQAKNSELGVYQAARNLRKQGVPLFVALLLLTGGY